MNPYQINNGEIYGKRNTIPRRWLIVPIIIATVGVGAIIAVGSNIVHRGGDNAGFNDRHPGRDTQLVRPCRREDGGRLFDCTDEATERIIKGKKIKMYVNEETIKATVTAYDQQAFPGRNAAGYLAVVDYSTACPRSIPLFSRLYSYYGWKPSSAICDDRTALRFDGRFDRFVATRKEAVEWGIHENQDITIIYPRGKPREEMMQF